MSLNTTCTEELAPSKNDLNLTIAATVVCI